MEILPSDYLCAFRRRFREIFSPGKLPSQAEIGRALVELNSAIALVKELEEDLAILEHREKVRRDGLRNRRNALGITDITDAIGITETADTTTIARLPAARENK